MKAHCSITTLLAAAFLIPFATQAASTVTFDNKSGQPALVKVVGPTDTSVSVENSKRETVTVQPGHYFIKIRYGAPGKYSYSKGDEFDVSETPTTTSKITITLHKVVSGNYDSKPISEAEFGSEAPLAEQASPAAIHESPPGQVQEDPQPTWARIILDTEFFPSGEFGSYWDSLQNAYLGAATLSRNWDPHADLFSCSVENPVSRDKFLAKFGKPDRIVESDHMTWNYYGPIGFRFESWTDKEVLFVIAPNDFYKVGFRKKATAAKRQPAGAGPASGSQSPTPIASAAGVSGPSTSDDAPWQKDWREFVKAMADGKHLSASNYTRMTVQWSGVVLTNKQRTYKISDKNHTSLGVFVRMHPPLVLEDPSQDLTGSTSLVGLVPTESQIASWSGVKPGDTIVFRGKLGCLTRQQDGLTSPVGLGNPRKGVPTRKDTLAIVGLLNEAELVRVLSK